MKNSILGFDQEVAMKLNLEIEELVVLDYISRCFDSDDHETVALAGYEWVEIKPFDFLNDLPLLFVGRPNCQLESSRVSKMNHYLAVLTSYGCIESFERSEATENGYVTHFYYRITEKAPRRVDGGEF